MGLSILDLTTAFWHALVAELQRDPPPIAGAALAPGARRRRGSPAAALRAWQRRASGGPSCNTYGPTEAAVIATAFTAPLPFDQPCLPIGRPIDNTRIYLLDAAAAGGIGRALASCSSPGPAWRAATATAPS